MDVHAYVPKFDGINYDGKQLPGRDPETGRFVSSKPNVHDPAWHDKETHLVEKTTFILIDEIPSWEGLTHETEMEYEARVYGDDDGVTEEEIHLYESDDYTDQIEDRYSDLAKRHNISEDAEEIFNGMIFDNNTDQSEPSFYGEDRTLIRDKFARFGDIGWNDGQKDRYASNGRRRNKGLNRAPKWQQFAGGCKAGRRSIKTLPIEETAPLDFTEVLKAFSAVMQ
jgi:hypothetical protein